MSIGHLQFHKALILYFPKQLTLLRESMNLSKEEMAQKLSIELPEYKRYESGRAHPTLDFIHHIVKTTGVEQIQLLSEPNGNI